MKRARAAICAIAGLWFALPLCAQSIIGVQPAALDQPQVPLTSLSNVQITLPQAQSGIIALPLDSPPISGFIPRVVFGLTDEDVSDDFDWYSQASSLAGNTSLPSAASPKYLVATYDTGAQSSIINVAADSAFNLAGAGLDGSYEQTLIGANGIEYGIASDALGLYVTGFQGVASTTGGNITVNPGSLKGQINTSIIVLEDPNSGLPNIIGTPMTAMYQTRISNSSTRHLTVGAQTYKSPDVSFVPQGTAIPGGYSRLTLSAVPQGGFTDPPAFIPNFETFDHDDPQTGTFWGSLLATATVSDTGGPTTTQFLFDTGAEVSVLSEDTANSIGIFPQDEITPPDFYVDILGVGGTVLQKPGYFIEELRFTTTTGLFTYTNVPVVIVDLPDPRDPLHQTLPGLIGTNLFHDRDVIIDTSGTPYVYFGPLLTPEWTTNGDGNWSQDANWMLGSPQEMDAPANFLGAINAPQTITVDGDFTAGSMKFDNANRYTINGPGSVTLQSFFGSSSITVVSGSHTISVPMTFANDTVISVAPAASTLTMSGDVTAPNVSVTKTGLGTVETKNVRAAGLDVSAGTLKVLANGTPNSASGTSVVEDLAIAGGAVLDLTNNSMVIKYGADIGTLEEDVRLHLQSGRLISSNADLARGLGYGDNALLGQSDFAGQTVDSESVLIKFTYLGDTNLDGQVSISDLGTLASNWQSMSAFWTDGDFNYDGKVTISDLGTLASNWQAGVGNPLGMSFAEALAAVGLGGANVPEPGVAMAALGLLAALCRRNRRPLQ